MKRPVITLYVILISLCLSAQSMSPGDIPSPNASDLGRFGDVPVSYYTGRPEVTIPLYELNVRGVTLPITLNYDAGGVLMNSLPGWTGHNWTLQAGGCITRIQNGRADELIYPDNSGFFNRDKNYFNSYSLLKNKYDSLSNENFDNWMETQLLNGDDNLSPDIYVFNMMGITGRFFLGNDGGWKVQCDKNIDVLFDITNSNNYIYPFFENFPNQYVGGYQPKTIKGFVLRDENGIEYRFGGSTGCIEYSCDLFGMTGDEYRIPWIANSWYLKEVVDRFGNVLFSFNYFRGEFLAQLYNIGSATSEQNTFNGLSGYDTEYYSFDNFYPYQGRLLSPVYLSEIQVIDERKITFMSMKVNRSMDEIYGDANNYSAIQQAVRRRMSYSGQYPIYYLQTNNQDITPYQANAGRSNKIQTPFESCALRKLINIILSGPNLRQGRSYFLNYSSSGRLFLTKVFAKDYEGSTFQQYAYDMNYYNSNSLPSSYVTRAIDHWGYYNGSEYSYPVTSAGLSSFGSQRAPSATYTKYGSLAEIVYPTGGVSTFEYEQNTYSVYPADNRQSVVTLSNDVNAGGLRIKKIISYEDATKTKILQQREFCYTDPSTGRSSGELYAVPIYYWPNWSVKSPHGGTSVISMFRTTSIIPLSNSFGPHIGYSYVKETLSDGKSIEYRYHNISETMDEPYIKNFVSSVPTPYDRFSDRSYMRGHLKSVSYYQYNSLQRRVDYKYRTDSYESQYVMTCNIGLHGAHISAAFNFIVGDIYKLFYPRYDVVSVTTRNYFGGNETKDSIYYINVDETLNMTMPYSHIANIRYTQEERHIRGTDVSRTWHDWLLENGSLPKRLACEKFYLRPVKTIRMQNNDVLSENMSEYAQFGSHILPRYELEKKNNASTNDTLVTYLSYSTTGRPLQYKEIAKPLTTLTWVNHDCYLSSKQIGSTHTSSYGYDVYGNMISVTDERGNSVTYQYDGMNRLTDIIDTNGKHIKHFDYQYINNQ